MIPKDSKHLWHIFFVNPITTTNEHLKNFDVVILNYFELI